MSTHEHGSCCDEGAATAGPGLSRRGLLRGLGLAGLAGLGGTAGVFGTTTVTMAPAAAAASAGASGSPWAVVVLSLRGAADGLSLVVPHGDPAYLKARPRIGIPTDQLLHPDSFFGLHPALKALSPLWTSGRLAAVHATGLPVANRSHFAAMEAVEDADPGSRERVGWLNRLLDATSSATEPSPLRGLGLGGTPTSLAGPAPTMAMSSNVGGVKVAGAASLVPSDKRMASLATAWAGAPAGIGRGMNAALGAVAAYAPVKDVPDASSTYPANDLGRALATVARTIKGDVGSAVFTVDHGNWDMHTNLGSSTGGWMVNQATTLAGGIAAFFADLGSLGERVTLVTISEFGRRVVENADKGLDHGWGNVMLLAGAGVKGGRYHGRWPGLATTSDADLAVTTDYRSVLAEVVATRTGASTATVFPGFAPEAVGVMSSL